MNQETWTKHILRRSDLTLRITHLTRRTDDLRAIEVLYKILDTKTIKGSDSTGFIRGKRCAVCFQELPLYSLAENILFEDEHPCCDQSLNEHLKFRYEGFGLRFNKGTMFSKGARPVIYGTKEELDQLPEDIQWRCVQMNLNNSSEIIDWSHEREWRFPNDFKFEYSEVEVVLGCNKSYKEFIEHYAGNPILNEINGIIVLDSALK